MQTHTYNSFNVILISQSATPLEFCPQTAGLSNLGSKSIFPPLLPWRHHQGAHLQERVNYCGNSLKQNCRQYMKASTSATAWRGKKHVSAGTFTTLQQTRRFPLRAYLPCGQVLMPMVHVAARSFFDATLRSPRFHNFDAIYHEGPPPGCTAAGLNSSLDTNWDSLGCRLGSVTVAEDDPAYPTWRFTPSLRHASPSGAFLELPEAQR